MWCTWYTIYNSRSSEANVATYSKNDKLKHISAHALIVTKSFVKFCVFVNCLRHATAINGMSVSVATTAIVHLNTFNIHEAYPSAKPSRKSMKMYINDPPKQHAIDTTCA
mmetsp:Transcript_13867/g.15309  ORF Transcript_13867/g.15309 Transcript_13867/m.15309 type:complete len:110 (+) Transcript_13867:263-592(+)